MFYALTVLWEEPAFGYLFLVIATLLAVLIGLCVGIWATGRMSSDAQPDPGSAVWDEFVGMWITCLPIVLLALFAGLLLPPYWIVLPFILFRVFDVVKPWPCRGLERLHGGLGIMLDDVAAGIWGFLVFGGLLLVLVFNFGLLGN